MPRRSAHRPKEAEIDALVEQLREQGIDPEYVSYPCTVGLADEHAHADCSGKVVMMPSGQYARCRCPHCDHPEPRVRPQ